MPAKTYKIIIIAGEASGDNIGANLINSITDLGINAQFSGIGGNKMIAHSFKSIHPMNELSVMGWTEVLPKIFQIKKCFDKTTKHIIDTKPDIIITIDYPGFNFSLVKKLREKYKLKIPIIHYVAPTVWAYNPQRVNFVAKYFTHQILILPFEKQYFDAANFPSTFVGHPITQEKIEKVKKEHIEKTYNLSPKDKIITVMPGSRKGEVKQHIKIFSAVIKKLNQRHSNLKIFIPTLPHLVPFIKSLLPNDHQYIISDKLETKQHLLQHSKAAIIKSGTSSVEVMNYKVPMVVAYKMNFITSIIIRSKVKCKFASICNLLFNKEIIPEHLLEKCIIDNIFNDIDNIISSKEAQKLQKDAFTTALKQLSNPNNIQPSLEAAKVIKKHLK